MYTYTPHENTHTHTHVISTVTLEKACGFFVHPTIKVQQYLVLAANDGFIWIQKSYPWIQKGDWERTVHWVIIDIIIGCLW